MIKKYYEEYIVEFRVTIVDLTYSKLLRDPDAVQYSEVKQELTDRVRTTLQRQEVGTVCTKYRRVDIKWLICRNVPRKVMLMVKSIVQKVRSST